MKEGITQSFEFYLTRTITHNENMTRTQCFGEQVIKSCGLIDLYDFTGDEKDYLFIDDYKVYGPFLYSATETDRAESLGN